MKDKQRWFHVFLYEKHNLRNRDYTLTPIIMKRFILRIINGCFCLSLLCAAVPVNAQLNKEQIKEQKEYTKYTRDQLNKKATKAARKEAKKLSKQGWQATPGALPLEKQLDRSYLMQYEYDESGYPKYLMGEAMSIGENYDAAKMQAIELAKQNLAGQIQTEVTALIENTVGNQQLTAEEATSITQTIAASKNIISQKIGRVVPVVEVYRATSNQNKEVLVRIAYNSAMAKEAAKSVIRDELEKKGDELHKKLSSLLGW